MATLQYYLTANSCAYSTLSPTTTLFIARQQVVDASTYAILDQDDYSFSIDGTNQAVCGFSIDYRQFFSQKYVYQIQFLRYDKTTGISTTANMPPICVLNGFIQSNLSKVQGGTTYSQYINFTGNPALSGQYITINANNMLWYVPAPKDLAPFNFETDYLKYTFSVDLLYRRATYSNVPQPTNVQALAFSVTDTSPSQNISIEKYEDEDEEVIDTCTPSGNEVSLSTSISYFFATLNVDYGSLGFFPTLYTVQGMSYSQFVATYPQMTCQLSFVNMQNGTTTQAGWGSIDLKAAISESMKYAVISGQNYLVVPLVATQYAGSGQQTVADFDLIIRTENNSSIVSMDNSVLIEERLHRDFMEASEIAHQLLRKPESAQEQQSFLSRLFDFSILPVANAQSAEYLTSHRYNYTVKLLLDYYQQPPYVLTNYTQLTKQQKQQIMVKAANYEYNRMTDTERIQWGFAPRHQLDKNVSSQYEYTGDYSFWNPFNAFRETKPMLGSLDIHEMPNKPIFLPDEEAIKQGFGLPDYTMMQKLGHVLDWFNPLSYTYLSDKNLRLLNYYITMGLNIGLALQGSQQLTLPSTGVPDDQYDGFMMGLPQGSRNFLEQAGKSDFAYALEQALPGSVNEAILSFDSLKRSEGIIEGAKMIQDGKASSSLVKSQTERLNKAFTIFESTLSNDVKQRFYAKIAGNSGGSSNDWLSARESFENAVTSSTYGNGLALLLQASVVTQKMSAPALQTSKNKFYLVLDALKSSLDMYTRSASFKALPQGYLKDAVYAVSSISDFLYDVKRAVDAGQKLALPQIAKRLTEEIAAIQYDPIAIQSEVNSPAMANFAQFLETLNDAPVVLQQLAVMTEKELSLPGLGVGQSVLKEPSPDPDLTLQIQDFTKLNQIIEYPQTQQEQFLAEDIKNISYRKTHKNVFYALGGEYAADRGYFKSLLQKEKEEQTKQILHLVDEERRKRNIKVFTKQRLYPSDKETLVGQRFIGENRNYRPIHRKRLSSVMEELEDRQRKRFKFIL